MWHCVAERFWDAGDATFLPRHKPLFSLFCERITKFALPPIKQEKVPIHLGVKNMLGTVMAISFLGKYFSKICNVP